MTGAQMRLARAALAALAAAAVPGARAAEPNVITRVELADRGAALVLTILGSRPPSFTTFAAESPARFVVDVAGAELRGVELERVLDSGPVSRVRAEQVAGEGSSTARVAVAFRGELEGAEVATRGNALVVTFPKAAAPAVLALAAPHPDPLPAERGEGARPPISTPTATDDRFQGPFTPSVGPQARSRGATTPPAPVRAEPVEARAAAASPQDVREFGFRQLPEASRVYVRTAGAPRFSVREDGERIVLALDRVRPARRNDLRPLDTTFFRSAVARVTPRREGGDFVLEIALRSKVIWRQQVEGDLLAIDFELPAP